MAQPCGNESHRIPLGPLSDKNTTLCADDVVMVNPTAVETWIITGLWIAVTISGSFFTLYLIRYIVTGESKSRLANKFIVIERIAGLLSMYFFVLSEFLQFFLQGQSLSKVCVSTFSMQTYFNVVYNGQSTCSAIAAMGLYIGGKSPTYIFVINVIIQVGLVAIPWTALYVYFGYETLPFYNNCIGRTEVGFMDSFGASRDSHHIAIHALTYSALVCCILVELIAHIAGISKKSCSLFSCELLYSLLSVFKHLQNHTEKAAHMIATKNIVEKRKNKNQLNFFNNFGTNQIHIVSGNVCLNSLSLSLSFSVFFPRMCHPIPHHNFPSERRPDLSENVISHNCTEFHRHDYRTSDVLDR